jgi:hypothetical protein
LITKVIADSGLPEDFEQTLSSQTDSMLVFDIENVENMDTTDVRLYFPIGRPANYEVVEAGFSLTPKVL